MSPVIFTLKAFSPLFHLMWRANSGNSLRNLLLRKSEAPTTFSHKESACFPLSTCPLRQLQLAAVPSPGVLCLLEHDILQESGLTPSQMTFSLSLSDILSWLGSGHYLFKWGRCKVASLSVCHIKGNVMLVSLYTGNVNSDHLVKVISSRFLGYEARFAFVIN